MDLKSSRSSKIHKELKILAKKATFEVFTTLQEFKKLQGSRK